MFPFAFPPRSGSWRGPLACVLLSGCLGAEAPQVYVTPTPNPHAGDSFQAEGTWAGYQVLSQYVQNIIPGQEGEDQLQTVSRYTLVSLQPGETEGTLRYLEQECLMLFSQVYGSNSSLSSSFFEHSQPAEFPVRLSSPSLGATFSLEEQLLLRGVTLDNPATDPLPDDETDSRVSDFDGDGNPGFTISVKGPAFISGWVWAVERLRFSMEGTVYSADSISGKMRGQAEDQVLTTSNEDIIPDDTEVWPDETEEHNFFFLERVADSFTCQDLVAQRQTLFEGAQ